MLAAIFVAKLLDLTGLLIAGVIVLLIKSKWGIIISGLIASLVTIIIIQSTGRGMHAEIIVPVFFAGTIAHSIHAGMVYYIKHFVLNKIRKGGLKNGNDF